MRKNPHYKFVWKPDHPLAHRRGIVREHRVVLYDKIGDGTHQCHWCKKEVVWHTLTNILPDSLLADHLDGDINNNSPENLVPSCNKCNSKRTVGIKDGEVVYVDGSGRRYRGKINTCKHCLEEYVAPDTPSTRKSRGQTFCSRACYCAYAESKRITRACKHCRTKFKIRQSQRMASCSDCRSKNKHIDIYGSI